MLSIGETVADAFPTRDRGNYSCHWDSQAKQNADSEKDQFSNTEDTIHGGSLPENSMD